MTDDEFFEDDDDGQPKTHRKREKSLAQLELEAKEANELLAHVGSGVIDTLRDRVAYVLNRFSDARNSDVEMVWLYWQTFDSDKFPGHYVTKEHMFALSRVPSLIRERARIQNTYKLFQADDEVKEYRGTLEEDARQQAVGDKPNHLRNTTVYIDETGKQGDFLCVGGLWIPDSGVSVIKVRQEIDEWRNEKDIKYEFHFSDLKKAGLQNYKDFFALFLRLNPSAGFKITVVRNHGFAELNGPISDLTFHLLNDGIRHEDESGRAPLPRLLQVWMDEDEAGPDALKIANVKERLHAQQHDGLYLDVFYAVSSHSNYFIQAVDLFTGAVNRKLNHSGDLNNKDELSDYILNITGMAIGEINTENTSTDNSIVFNLDKFNLEP